ncbi:MAG: ABC transporter permease [Lachnospiraceae bacterium]|jgi:hypothetical protein|nr:ABC transporter permease [Lachnospiraceae bacterium]
MAEKHAGRFGQTGIYLERLFRVFINEKGWKVLLMSAFIAIVVAYVVGTNMFVSMEGTTIGALAFVCVCIWDGFFNSIQSVCKERDIIKREHRTGMHITAYMLSQMIFQAVICALQVVIQLIVYRIVGVNFLTRGVVTGKFVPDIFITLFLITYTADMMALMVSCIVKTTTAAMTVVPFLLIIELLFSGVAFPLSGASSKIADFTISKWGIYSLCTESDYNSLPSSAFYSMLTKFQGVPEVKKIMEIFRQKNLFGQLAEYAGKNLQVSAYSYSMQNIMKDWGMLLLFCAIYIVIGTVVLEFIDHDKR